MMSPCTRVLQPSYAYVNFSRLSIASVDGKQHFSAVVFSAVVGDFILRKVTVSGSYPYTQDSSAVIKVVVLFVETSMSCGTSDESWVRPGNRNFLYNQNSTRALNTTSLKYCLPLTDAIDRREKIHVCV